MFKKVIWILLLLVMTVCTLIFSGKVNFSKVSAESAELEPFEPTESMGIFNSAFESATSVVAESVTPTQVDVEGEEGVEKTVEAAESLTGASPKFVLQKGSPTYLANFNYLDQGCEWQGVAGQVFNRNHEPRKYLIVKVFGTWNGQEISQTAVTGMVEGKPYGKGSYEIVLGDIAIDSTEPLYIQLFKSDGTVLSEPIQFSTKAKCNRNLVLINFVKN